MVAPEVARARTDLNADPGPASGVGEHELDRTHYQCFRWGGRELDRTLFQCIWPPQNIWRASFQTAPDRLRGFIVPLHSLERKRAGWFGAAGKTGSLEGGAGFLVAGGRRVRQVPPTGPEGALSAGSRPW